MLYTGALKRPQGQLGIKANKLQNDCLVRWNSTIIMLQRLHEQRLAEQPVLSDEAVTKPSVQKSLTMKASQWELVEQLIPLLLPLAKATEIMCGELHVVLSFIYLVIFNMINITLPVQSSDLAAVRNFKITVGEQLKERFKLESDDLLARLWPVGLSPGSSSSWSKKERPLRPISTPCLKR